MYMIQWQINKPKNIQYRFIDLEKIPKSQACIIAVAHDEYKIKLESFISKLYSKGFIFDFKSIFYKNKLPRSFNYWSL